MTKIGVIGVGGMGSYHCHSLKNVQDAEFVGVWDISSEAAKAAAEKYEVKAFDTAENLLSEIEGVVIATPAFYHTDPVTAAAEGRVHML